jgi:hypothetical protein
MIRIIQIDNNPKEKAFLEIAEALGYTVEHYSEEIEFTQDQIASIKKSKKSLIENGGTPHDVVMEKMKSKYPNILRS